MNTYMDNYLISQYGYAGLDLFKMAPILPKTPDEAILLSNLYQVQSAVAKLAAQQELVLRNSMYNSQPTYIPSSLPSPSQSVSSSPSMSPTRADSVSPLPYQFGYHQTTTQQQQQQQQSFVPYEKPSRNQPYRRKRRSNDPNQSGLKRAKTSGKVTQRLTSTATTSSRSSTTNKLVQEPSKKTFLDLYEAYGVIGVGGGGMVYAGRRITDKLPVAIKRVMREKVKRWEKVQGHTVPQEIALMLRVYGHEGVIKLVDWYECLDSFILIMERPENSVDLFDYIREKGKINEHEAKIIFKQVIGAVAHIHSSGVVHRDIKDENIVLNRETGAIKIIDFGCGTLLKAAPYRDFSGTPEFYPPEWFKKRYYYARSAAIWSLGVLLYDMVCGEIPFKSKEKIMENELRFKHDVSDEVKDLIHQLLNAVPEKRPTIDQISKHPWMMP